MKMELQDLSKLPSEQLGTPAKSDSAPDPLDAFIWSSLANITRGASPISYATAWFDYLSHLSVAPGYRARLAREGTHRLFSNWLHMWRATMFDPNATDTTNNPFLAERGAAALTEAYDDWVKWLTETCSDVAGVSQANADRVSFSLRQGLEAAHPRNFFASNPDALRALREEHGENLIRGWMNFVQDFIYGEIGGIRSTAEQKKVGEQLAITPGRVVYRNRLIELIQYEPATPKVQAEPVLIVPAWIMKYYILDLSPGHSLIRYLVEQGYTVFAISWRNPASDDRDLGFDDYRRLGVLDAMDVISELIPNTGIHALGYCLGGTLLSVAAAGLARDGDERIASLTLLAAQTDFSDAGELSLYIDNAQLSALEAGMSTQGFLDGDQMAGAFSMLRSRDLIWRRMQEEYFLGRRNELIDLMIWNNDTTRMPARMHSEYLRRFFLNNDFANGRITVDDRPVAISDIRAPIFALGTTKDHVAPWRSVYKIHLFADTEVTFALTNGGHNAGVISPPGHPRRHHHIYTKSDAEHFMDPETWKTYATKIDGSWWLSWADWLETHSSGLKAPRKIRAAEHPGNLISKSDALPEAPGEYVHQ